ncbi:putative dimethyl sulfoxide reductase chain YnfE precursor [Variibacter gotjawalensis]|uniref:Putative dimethyl sulfoxide reductase chain YnfE n=1 Tax=Variibacter gotjawalensis TaxID=1333996 RepID=A0A0S3PYC6_9BRAD|nr:molybdopterin oxidoreductase family protein [Variibacter gotjawalensis]NIK46786.1 anaerobic selenocysteine-containing dehydrogenase [Variibacter gotjawalensis]RZS48690.1 anaerobic selenocysteine-containing dehydrogenase [Variibacter gotjawalensis]BAT60949.1 putative dimethyl sulfoxide reductase chain YnfE precursor [Variibacter gotjawalensis]
MNQTVRKLAKPVRIGASACPHDCPSTCALEIDVIDDNTIGRVRGADEGTYTSGVICAKVARYAERAHHPDRLMKPLRRVGPKGSGEYAPISWDDALDIVAEKFLAAEARYGAETVWPYYYAGTMGLVMRDGINRLTHAKKYSRFFSTICVNPAWSGFIAGTGKLAGPDPREMAKSDVVVIWGTNPVNTQVNVMTHAARARKERGAKIVAVDIYMNGTMQAADLPVLVRPGTDGALACAVMHCLFRDGHADWEFLREFTDAPDELAAHVKSRDPQWASQITGCDVETIEAFAKLVGENKRTFFRLGYGFARQRNGAVNMHAASCIAAVTGAWKLEGGGAFHNNGAIYHWDKSLTEGHDAIDQSVRQLDQSRIGAILCGEEDVLMGGPPVTAMLIQNTNPATVAPDQTKVRRGFARDDLFVCVHEQFMTETARIADIVLPATMFVEHDDLYQTGGAQNILLGPKLINAPGECRSNHDVICALAKRLGAEHRGFTMSPRELINETLQISQWGSLAELEAKRWVDAQPDFDTAHYTKGFAYPDGKFRFKPDWPTVPFNRSAGLHGPHASVPKLPDHWPVIEEATEEFPFRLATSPSRSFLNTTFNETPSSIAREKRPMLMINPADAANLAVAEGDLIVLNNPRGEVRIHATLFDGVRRGVVIAESIWPNDSFVDGKGINTLTGADAIAPFGGAAFHDNRVAIRKA